MCYMCRSDNEERRQRLPSAASDTPAACVWKLPERLGILPSPGRPSILRSGSTYCRARCQWQSDKSPRRLDGGHRFFSSSRLQVPHRRVAFPSRRAMDFCRHLLLAAVLVLVLELLLAGCASAASRGAGSFDPSRVVQLSWRPR